MTHPFQPGDQILAYVRDSGGDRQNLSTAQQEKAIRDWCADNNLSLTRIYSDAARSGGSMAGRDQLDALLNYIAGRPKIAGVVFWSYSRLARNYDDAQYVRSTIRRAGYIVHSLEESIPPGDVGRVIESMIDFTSAQYRRDLSQATRRGMEYVVRQFHVYPKPRVPRGYRKVPVVIGRRRSGAPHIASQLEIDPAFAPLVQQAFAMRLAGATFAEIHAATHLFEQRTSYANMIANPLYTGRLEWNGELIDNFCPPLVDDATFAAIAARTEERWGRFHPRRAESPYLLSGILYCGLCGSPMHGKADLRSNYRIYHCHAVAPDRFDAAPCPARRIPAQLVETAILDQLRAVLLEPAQLAALYTAARSEHARQVGEKPTDAARIEREIAETKRALRNVVQAISAAGHSTILLTELRTLESRLEGLQGKSEQVREELAIIPELPDLTPDQLTRFGVAVWGEIERADFRRRQLLLRQIVPSARAVYQNKNLTLHLDIALAFGNM